MKLLVAGLAKTGTTALYYLLRDALLRQVQPRDVVLLFEPDRCPPADELAAAAYTLAKIIVKPGVDAKSFAHFERKVALVRDPRDRIVSEILYSRYHARYAGDPMRVRMVLETLHRKERRPRDVSLLEIYEVMQRSDGSAAGRNELVEHVAGEAARFDAYVRETPDALIYRYEDLVEGRYEPLERFLELAIHGKPQVPSTEIRVVRTKRYGDWRNWMTDEDIAIFRPLMEPVLAAYGYDAHDWRPSTQPVIAPEHCSGYVVRLVAEARARDLPFRGFA